MKKTIAAILAALTLSACTTSTKYGPCIGVVDTPKPNMNYDPSWWNLFMAFVFSETIVVPAYVILWDVKCPQGTASSK